MKFTQIPVDTFENLQLNAGIIVDSFNPETLEIGHILGATTGGIQFRDNVSFEDFGSDVDNCPRNMKELKKITSHEVTMSGTFVTVSKDTAIILAGAADSESDTVKIVPRNDLLNKDFKELWWVGDYSDQNTGDSAGYLAIRLMNSLNTGGFQIQSTDRGKGQFAFSFMGHYSMDAQDVVPYEIYVKGGTATVIPSITLNHHRLELEEDDTVQLTATVVPADATVTWTSADTSAATVSDGAVTGVAEGSSIVTAAITIDGVTYNDTCTIIVIAE